MKKVISLLLVLILCAYMPCAALAAESSPPNTAPSVPDSPSTGDTFDFGIWLVIMILALVAIVISTVCYKRSQKN